MLFKKFMIPPIVPALPRGAISDGMDQATGAAAAKPLNAIEIQKMAQTGLVLSVAPNTASPNNMPRTRTDLRTSVSSYPRVTRRSISHPPTMRSVIVGGWLIDLLVTRGYDET